MNCKYLIAILAITYLSASPLAEAATIGDDFGTYIVVLDPDPEMKVGDFYFAVDASGKGRAKVQISSVEGKNVEASVLKGHTVSGQKLIRAKNQSAEVAKKTTREHEESSQGYRSDRTTSQSIKWFWGFGLAYFNLRTDISPKPKYDLGLGLAALGEYRLGNLYVESGLKFYQAGAKNESSGAKFTYTLNYLGLPIVAKYAMAPTFRLKAGLMMSYLISSKYKVEFSGVTLSDKIPLDGGNKIDELALLGFEWVPDGSSGFWLEFLLNYGIKDFSTTASSTSTSAKLGNQGFTLLLGSYL